MPINTCLASVQTSGNDLNTGSKSWQINKKGVHFSLTQIQSQQGQAFYSNRGFSLKQIDDFVQSCVFMAVIRNDNAKNTLHYKLSNWRVYHDGKQRKLKPVTTWLQQLATPKTSKAALIAFKWAQFPSEQSYQPGGDWNQGMLSIGLQAKQVFTIDAQWTMLGKTYTSRLTDVQCAE